MRSGISHVPTRYPLASSYAMMRKTKRPTPAASYSASFSCQCFLLKLEFPPNRARSVPLPLILGSQLKFMRHRDLMGAKDTRQGAPQVPRLVVVRALRTAGAAATQRGQALTRRQITYLAPAQEPRILLLYP